MARRSAPAEDSSDSDRIAGFAHPRETFILKGHGVCLARMARMLRAGRLPGAWLLCGPPGIGKATLAYRVARYLLAHGASADGPEDLAVSPDNPDARQIAAQAHPGLLVLRRAVNPRTGKLMRVLSVDEVRRMTDFFGMTAGAGGWRVAIIDTVDDMNESAANALLKVAEEPPKDSLLLLVSNMPGRLLPTIRSRCQRQDLRPLDDTVMDDLLRRHLPDSDAKTRTKLIHLAGGSIGAALALSGGEGAWLAEAADRMIAQAAAPDTLALLALGDKLVRIPDGLDQFGAFLTEAIGMRIRARALAGTPHLDRWLALLARLENDFSRAVTLNLEPRAVVLNAARALAQTAQEGVL